MNKTVLFKKRPGENINYDIKILKEFDIKEYHGTYVKINEDKKVYITLFNLVSDTLDAKENTKKLTDLEEELVYGCDMDYDIIVPLSFVNKPIMVYGKIVKIKEKHIVQEHIPTTFKVYEPATVNVKDSNIIVINYDFTSGKELSFAEGLEAYETGKDFETNCLDFFNPPSLDTYCDVVIVKKDKSYISLKDLLANTDDRYTVKHMRETHMTQKMLIAGSFKFKQSIDLYIEDYKSLFILHREPFDITKTCKSVVKINTENIMAKYVIGTVRNQHEHIFSYNCNTNIYISKDTLNKRLAYDDMNIMFTKEDIKKE